MWALVLPRAGSPGAFCTEAASWATLWTRMTLHMGPVGLGVLSPVTEGGPGLIRGGWSRVAGDGRSGQRGWQGQRSGVRKARVRRMPGMKGSGLQ